MNQDNQKLKKKRKPKTSQELIEMYAKKIEELKKKEKDQFNKKLSESFSFLLDHVDVLEKIKKFKGNKKFESKFITFVKNFEIEEDKR